MENKSRKILGMILKIPLVLVVVISFIASLYLASKNLYGISYVTAIIFGIIVLLYFIGEYLIRKSRN